MGPTPTPSLRLGAGGRGGRPGTPRQDPRPRTGAHTQLAEGSAGPDTPRPEGGPSIGMQEAHQSLEGQTGPPELNLGGRAPQARRLLGVLFAK